jgi:hypothetical protein
LPQAIDYARKNLASFSDVHMADLQQAMALLAFRPDTLCDAYKVSLSSFSLFGSLCPNKSSTQKL